MMIEVVWFAFACGIGMGALAMHTATDVRKKHADSKLVVDNKYLHEEVKRLRAQVALHINEEISRPASYPAGQNTVASTVGAR